VKAAKEKGEEPTEAKRTAKKKKLTRSVPGCEVEAAVDSGSEKELEEDGAVGATLFFVESKLNSYSSRSRACP
jgi:hypothetical protein